MELAWNPLPMGIILVTNDTAASITTTIKRKLPYPSVGEMWPLITQSIKWQLIQKNFQSVPKWFLASRRKKRFCLRHSILPIPSWHFSKGKPDNANDLSISNHSEMEIRYRLRENEKLDPRNRWGHVDDVCAAELFRNRIREEKSIVDVVETLNKQKAMLQGRVDFNLGLNSKSADPGVFGV